MNPLLAQFIAESRDQLERINADLLAIETSPHDLDKLNAIFRTAHTIKGSSGLFENRPITFLVHAAEDLLDALRSQAVSLECETINLLLEAFDQVSQWLDELERTESLPTEWEAVAQTLGAKLRALLKNRASESAVVKNQSSAPTFDDLTWIGRFPENERAALYRRLTESSEPLVVFRYMPDKKCFLNRENLFYPIQQIPGLAFLDPAPTEPWLPLAELEPHSDVLCFEGVACAPLTEVAKPFCHIPNQVAFLEISPQTLVIPTGRCDEDARCYDGFAVETLEMVKREDWARLRSTAATLLEAVEPADWIASALRWLTRLLESATPESAIICPLLEACRIQQGPDWLRAALTLNTTLTNVTNPTPLLSDEEQAAFQHIATEQLRILELPVEPESWPGRISSICASLANGLHYARCDAWLDELRQAQTTALETGDTAALRSVLARLLTVRAPILTPSPTPAEETSVSVAQFVEITIGDQIALKTLKVDQHKIDRLMNLIGELAVAKNSLPYLAQRAECVYGQCDLAHEMQDQYATINRIAQELQSSITQIRMMPVRHVFQRLPRLVHDLSRKLDKKINLIIEGEDTEADGNIIETLSDPLIHILRNSIDHGVEPPEERLIQGKSDTGQIRVRAYRDNNCLAIEITDDGRGVNVAAVKEKALRRGLLTAEQAETLSDHEMVQWIFVPGLSTTTQVSDLSGRGVGMDIVRHSVEKAGGTVTVHSQRGIGTDVRLTLPLSSIVSDRET